MGGRDHLAGLVLLRLDLSVQAGAADRLAARRRALRWRCWRRYPFALFYSAAYTESLFLLTVVAACYHFERDELWQAGLWGLIAGLTRPNGCLLSVVLALMAIRPLWSSGWRPTWPPPMEWTTARRSDRHRRGARHRHADLLDLHLFPHGQSAAVGRTERRVGTRLSQSGCAGRPTRFLDRSATASTTTPRRGRWTCCRRWP